VAHIRAMAVFQGGSGLPEDRFVNTFHFLSPQAYAGDRTIVADAVAGFYTTAYSSKTVGGYLSPYVIRGFQVRTYDLDTPGPGREPYVKTYTLGVMMTDGAVPLGNMVEEASVCLSYRAIPPYTARRRGRIYIGPLNTGAISAATSTSPSRVAGQFSTCIKNAALALVNTGLGWSVHSTKDGTYNLIHDGWVDDAFDTQRRRGAAVGNRNVWSAA
jgi:hypothetical protein